MNTCRPPGEAWLSPQHALSVFLLLFEGSRSACYPSVSHGPEQMLHSKYLLNNENKEALPVLFGLLLNT